MKLYLKNKISASKLTVIFRNDSPLIHHGDPSSYRRVTIDLTKEQIEKIALKWTGASQGNDIFESVSKCFLED